MAAIAKEVLSQMEQAAAQDPNVSFPVIVTMKPGAPFAAAERYGINVHHRFEPISALSGTATLAVIKSLATLPEVQLIELDGEMRALKPKSAGSIR